MPDTASDLARRLAANAEGGLPPLSVQRPARGPLVDGGRCPQHARPLDDGPPEGH